MSTGSSSGGDGVGGVGLGALGGPMLMHSSIDDAVSMVVVVPSGHSLREAPSVAGEGRSPKLDTLTFRVGGGVGVVNKSRRQGPIILLLIQIQL